MKIFIICNSLGGGGAERVGVNLANGFAEKGHLVSIITDVFQPSTYPVIDKVKIIPFCEKENGKIKKWSGAIRQIRKASKNEKPDVIIGIMQLCSLAAKIAVSGLGIPIIMSEHDSFFRPESFKLTVGEKISKYYLNKLYDSVTILTEADKEFIGKRLHNTVVMPNPLTFETANALPEKEKIILSAGRLSSWHVKGFDLLIKAWGKVCKENANEYFNNWRLQIAGDGKPEDYNYLKNIAEIYGVAHRTDFLGYRTDMIDLYKKSSIYVLSSRSEGLPMVVIEAMSQGCAVVAGENYGRTKEIITNDKEGLLCQMENIDDLAEKMQDMIVNESYRLKVQKNAIERSKDYSLDHIVNMWESLISKTIQ